MQIALSLNNGASNGPRTDVFALAGQSNMVGVSPFDGGAGFPAGTRQFGQTGGTENTLIPAAVPLDHSSAGAGTFGPWLQFAIDQAATAPATKLVFVPCAASGSSFYLNRWNPGDDRAQNLVNDLTALVAQDPAARLAGVLWHQGENDAQPIADGHQTIEDYTAALDALIRHVRAAVPGASKLPWVLGRLAPSFLSGGSAARNAAAEAINAVIADTPNRVAYTAVASADLLATSDGTHFDAAATRTLGARYQAALPLALANVPTVPAAVTGLAVTPGDEENALTWDAPANGGLPIADYRIEVDEGAGFAPVADSVSAARAFTHTGLTNDTPYTYRVAAQNAVGTGPASAAVSGTPIAGVPAEAGASGHWLFGSDNLGHAGLVSSETLTANNTAPTLSAAHATFTHDTGHGNGLLSGILDAGAVTFAAVVRVAPSRTLMFGGSLNAVGTDKGIAMWMSSGNLMAKARGLQKTVAVMPTGEWRFIAVSVSAANGIVMMLGDPSSPTTITGTGTGTAPNRAISAGEVFWGDTLFNDGFDMAEMILWPSALSAADLSAVRARSATRLAARGITLA